MDPHPQKIAHYTIESTLGQGGMGVVYLATDVLLRRRAALKLLAPHLSQDPQARRRFLNEGRAAATAALLCRAGVRLSLTEYSPRGRRARGRTYRTPRKGTKPHG